MGMEVDRLSALPDELLIRILSRLDLKPAASTLTLSKRWRFVWTDLPSLVFCKSSGENLKTFKAGVQGTLASRRGAALNQLIFAFFYDKCLESDVDVWVELAAKNKVQKLYLSLDSSRFDSDGIADYYTLHESMYSNSWLKYLHMLLCTMSPPTTVEWPSMTQISLHDCILPHQQIHNILSGCPQLTRLELITCRGFNRLEIGGRRFRSLRVDFHEAYGLLEIAAPYMRDLDVDICPKRGSLRLTNVVSLQKVELRLWADVTVVEYEMMKNAYQIFHTISCANTLAFRLGTLKVVSMMAMNGWQLPKFKTEYMEIDADTDVLNIHGAIVILESSPFLERLRICGFQDTQFKDELEYPTRRCKLNCDLLHLKAVKIVVYVNAENSCKSTFTLARTLLERAPILENMDILKSKWCGSPPTVFEDLVEKFETLFSYPKSSHKAIIVIS